jgi:hypothetical protein
MHIFDSDDDKRWKLRCDENVIAAIALYIAMGLDPGSFGRALLMNDKEAAYRSAHHMLYKHDGDWIPDHFKFVRRYVPLICRNTQKKVEAWMAHDGLEHADDGVKVLWRLTMGKKPWFLNHSRIKFDLGRIWGEECA